MQARDRTHELLELLITKLDQSERLAELEKQAELYRVRFERLPWHGYLVKKNGKTIRSWVSNPLVLSTWRRADVHYLSFSSPNQTVVGFRWNTSLSCVELIIPQISRIFPMTKSTTKAILLDLLELVPDTDHDNQAVIEQLTAAVTSLWE